MNALLNPEKLWIAANFMSTEQTRYYLCGVFVEPCETGVTMTATDGHRLVTCHDPQGVCSDPMIISLSKDTMQALKKADTVTIDENKQLSVNYGGKPTHIQPGSCEIDGTFPDWHRVIPAEITGEQAPGFNAGYLGDFKALAGFSKTAPIITIYQNGKDPAIISCGDPNIFAVQMPAIKASNSPDVPAWIQKAKAKAA